MTQSFKPARRALGLCLAGALLGTALLPLSSALAQTAVGTMTQRSVPVFSIASTSLLFGETVVFSGSAIVKSRYAPDPIAGDPAMVYQIDLSGVTARGLLSLRSFRIVSEETVLHPPLASTSFSYAFPYDSSGTFGLSLAQTRYGTANVALNLNTATGSVTSVTIGLQAR